MIGKGISNEVKFIITSVGLRKICAELGFGAKEIIELTVDKNKIINFGTEVQELWPNDIMGSGKFSYRREAFVDLHRTMVTLEEMPVVVVFTDSCIYINDILFH